jgi:hypothetical protein
MREPLTKYENTVQTIIIVPLTLSPLWLLLLVRQGVYIVNLCAFCFYKLIRKLTAFWQLQEFSLRNLPVDSSTSAVRRSPHRLSLRSSTFSPRLQHDVSLRIVLNIDGTPIASKSHTDPSHSQTSSLLTSSLSLRCSSPPHNPVYARCVDLSALASSLSSHRHSYISLLFRSRFIAYQIYNVRRQNGLFLGT